jgi:hypothetical protein
MGDKPEERFVADGEIIKSQPLVDRSGREYTLVTSAFMSCDKIDKQDDWTDDAELRDALHEFSMSLQKQTDPQESGLSYRHQRMVTWDQANVVEVFMLSKGDTFNGVTYERPTGMISFRVYDTDMRKEILTGKLKGMSVEGYAKRTEQPLPA